MFDVGGGELLLIILAILLLFGPKKIPEITKMAGKGFREIKKAQVEFQRSLHTLNDEVEEAAKPKTKPKPQKIDPPKQYQDEKPANISSAPEEAAGDTPPKEQQPPDRDSLIQIKPPSDSISR